MIFPVFGFEGFLDLTASMPDPVTGMAIIDVTGSSVYLSLDLNPDTALTFCVRPLVPAAAAGFVSCRGGFGAGAAAFQEHNLGVVGVDGFSEDDCAQLGGGVEPAEGFHPGVCNGPVVVDTDVENDSGVGAVRIAPDEAAGFAGLPAEVTLEAALPCGDEGPGDMAVLGLVSGLSRAEIHDFNNSADQTLVHDERGENFDCYRWAEEDGPGTLILSVPTLHGFGGLDLITVFVFDD